MARNFNEKTQPFKEPLKNTFLWVAWDNDYATLHRFWEELTKKNKALEDLLKKKPLQEKEITALLNAMQADVDKFGKELVYLDNPHEAIQFKEYIQKKVYEIRNITEMQLSREAVQASQSAAAAVPASQSVPAAVTASQSVSGAPASQPLPASTQPVPASSQSVLASPVLGSPSKLVSIPPGERAWYFKKFPHLTQENIRYVLTPESKELFRRGRVGQPAQGYIGLAEIDASGEIKLHLKPAYDSVDAFVKDPVTNEFVIDPETNERVKIGYRPELVLKPKEPDKPKEPTDEKTQREYDEKMERYIAQLAQYNAFLKEDAAWLVKWNYWKNDPTNFLDKNGVRFKEDEYVLTGDSYIRGNTGAAHDAATALLNLKGKGLINAQLLGFGIYKGIDGELLSDFRDRSHSQNSNSIAWHDAFFKNYVSNGIEIYGLAKLETLRSKDAISKIKKPAIILCSEDNNRYLINDKGDVFDFQANSISFSDLIKKADKESPIKGQFLSYDTFSNLKTMTGVADSILKIMGHKLPPGFLPPPLNEMDEEIKSWLIFDRARSLPKVVSDGLLNHLLENLPRTPDAIDKPPLTPTLKKDGRSKKLTSPLFDAVQGGDLLQVQRWIERGCSPNEIGCTRDMYEVDIDDPDLVKKAKSLFDIALDSALKNPLENRHIAVLCYLYEHPDFLRDKDLPTPLHFAIKKGDIPLIEAVVKYKPALVDKVDMSKVSPEIQQAIQRAGKEAKESAALAIVAAASSLPRGLSISRPSVSASPAPSDISPTSPSISGSGDSNISTSSESSIGSTGSVSPPSSPGSPDSPSSVSFSSVETQEILPEIRERKKLYSFFENLDAQTQQGIITKIRQFDPKIKLKDSDQAYLEAIANILVKLKNDSLLNLHEKGVILSGALQEVSQQTDFDSNIPKLYREMEKELDEIGVKPIGAAGELYEAYDQAKGNPVVAFRERVKAVHQRQRQES